MAGSVVQAAFVVVLTILICSETILAYPWQKAYVLRQANYWWTRQYLLMGERQEAFGGNLILNPIETKANEILMTAKTQEINDGFVKGNSFLPSRNFLEVMPEIEKSEVFKILRDLPKGGVLHVHDSAMVSLDYKLNNLTYRDNLYVCDENDTFVMKFFDTPNDQCNWQLLRDLRQNPDRAKAINEKIAQKMTMVVKNPNSVYETVNDAWRKFDSIFAFMNTWMAYPPVRKDHFYQGLQELYDDNVMYVEVRSGLSKMYDLNGTMYGPVEVARLYKEVSDRFLNDHPDFIGVKIIYAPSRFVENVDNYLKTMIELNKLYPDFVVGFDLVGQEDKGTPLIKFVDTLNTVNPDIQFFFHAGETNWDGEPTDMNIIDAVLLRSKRIGHGYALTKHPYFWDLMNQFEIAVEVCPISNQVLALVKDLRNHPATTLFATGSPVVISNDDPGLWNAKGLTHDFYEAFMALMSASSDLGSLKQLAMNSFIYSSLNNTEKQNALTRWQDKWDAFVDKLAQSNNGEM
ncbi:adenosine deaminase CECR1-like [Pseudomyrmex gracilis]|uniref:adenosine deaminase CECR1-like n=1 Tax=Pseudomyrmex gracilis TaxID=219809 RepID=UPI0009951A40|nr:adenosine deaminase CECR1-like [Pseudomyrmex gracilis]